MDRVIYGCIVSCLLFLCNSANSQSLSVSVVSSADVFCNGDSTGSIQAFAAGGVPTYTYQWDDPNAQITALATDLPTGTWTVTVTDAVGDTATASQTINEPNPLTNIVSFTDAGGCGACDGSATANIASGTPPYTYQWDDPNFQTNPSANGLCTGFYNVIVTDINGCSITSGVTITDPAGMTLTTSTTDPSFCGISNGTASISVSGGTAPYNYLWNDSGMQTTSTATGLAAGVYSVIVTDSVGCTAVNNLTLNDPGAPTLTVSNINNISCNGSSNGSATVSATGGSLPYSYQWNDTNSQTNSSATGLSAGTYNVTVTGSIGCSSTESVSITEPPVLNGVVTSSKNVSCSGNCDGQATITVNGGSVPYTYQWDPDTSGQNSATATGLCTGEYSVTVTDSNGCIVSDSVVIFQPAAISLDSITVDATCGNSNGSAIVIVTGGTTPYAYAWSSGGNSDTENGLSMGTYICMVTDSNGCSETIEVIINESNAPSVLTVSSDVSCNGGNDGIAVAVVSGGTLPYTYQWDDPLLQSTDSADGLIAGTYAVTITDSAGCLGSDSVSISEPEILSLTTSVNAETCPASNDGSAFVNVSGGILPYTYFWNDPNNQTTDTAIGLNAGIYNVTVTDKNNCSETATAAVNSASNLALAVSATNENCGAADGVAIANSFGGAPPYTYLWDDPNNQTTPAASELSSGVYTVNLTDGDGCVISDTAGITNDIQTCLVDIPNTFTPNGDGVNDTWEIKGIELYPDMTVEVFNRWGSRVFESQGYSEPWNGNYKGKELPMADYYYIIMLNKEESFTGTITIMK